MVCNTLAHRNQVDQNTGAADIAVHLRTKTLPRHSTYSSWTSTRLQCLLQPCRAARSLKQSRIGSGHRGKVGLCAQEAVCQLLTRSCAQHIGITHQPTVPAHLLTAPLTVSDQPCCALIGMMAMAIAVRSMLLMMATAQHRTTTRNHCGGG